MSDTVRKLGLAIRRTFRPDSDSLRIRKKKKPGLIRGFRILGLFADFGF